MSTVPPGDQTRPLFYRTIIAHFEGPDGETPLGVRVVEPAPESRQALRGNLYAIVDLVGENAGRTHLAESLLSAIQRTYFTRSGSQSQVLTEAVRQARLRVNEFNQSHPDQPVQLGVICAGLVRSRLMIAHSGPACAFITADNQIARYPSEIIQFSRRTSPPAVSSKGETPNGVDEQMSANPVNWEIYSQEVRDHTALFMGTPRWLDVVPVRTIAGTVAHINGENCSDAASGLLATSRRPDLPGLLLVIEQVDAPVAAPQAATQATPKRRTPLLGAAGLTSAVNARPPVVSVPDGQSDPATPAEADAKDDGVQEIQPDDASSDRIAPGETEIEVASDGLIDGSSNVVEPGSFDDAESPGASAAGALVVGAASASGRTKDELEGEAEDVVETSGTQEEQSSGPSALTTMSSGLAAGVLVGLDRSREVFRGMFPERRPHVEAVLDGDEAPEEGVYADEPGWDEDLADHEGLVEDVFVPSLAVAAEQSALQHRDATVVDDGSEDRSVSPESSRLHDVSAQVSAALENSSAPIDLPEPASGGRARLFITLAVLILVLVPVVVTAVYQQWGRDPAVSAASYTEMSQTFLLNAQTSLDNGDDESARNMFLKASDSLGDAVAITGHTPESDRMFDEINSGLAEVMQTRYLYQLTEPLIAFSGDAEPFRVMTVGENIFVMDRGQETVERYELDALREYVPDLEPELILEEGFAFDGAAVAGMVDMAWQPIVTGFEDRPKLLVLDRNGQIFSYDLRVDGVQPIEMDDPNLLQNASQIALFNGATYIADEGQNQIIRYERGNLGGPSTEWFSAETQPYISGLLGMEIDGDIWMLNSEGTLVRYRSGEQVPFSLDSGAVRADEPVDMAIGSQGDSSIFIADAAHDRILAFDKEGTYKYQLVASEGEPLSDMRGLYLDELDEKIYILTKAALYQHPLPE